MSRTYTEDFDGDRGGWWGWVSNSAGPRPLEHRPGVVTSRSPWWIDYNHAPPGAGYMHMVFSLSTAGPQGEVYRDIGGTNRFIAERCPTNFTSASINFSSSARLAGSIATDMTGAGKVIDSSRIG